MGALGLYSYWVPVLLLMVGIYAIVAHSNLVKKLIGMTILQGAVFLVYISMGNVAYGTAPILLEGADVESYSNPLPQVLVLTAIVVGIATLALGLAVVVRIKEAFGTIEEDEIQESDL